MTLTLIDRFHPRLRNQRQEAINAGYLHKLEEVELLEPQQLRPLALLSLLMLVIGGVFFALLNLAAYAWQTHAAIGGWGLLLWIIINIVGYILILPLHELVHAAAFLLWGGRPYFGTRLPYALYCGAKNQLFRRNQYLVVGLAPLVVITLAGIIFTLVSPALASYTIFATVGNISGAAGDVWAARRLLRLPPSVLVEDTEAGYRAWQLTPPLSSDRMPV
jgi:signal transduction histidine kinase